MTVHHFAPLIPIVTAPLLIAISGWNVWRVKYAYRVRGRRAVEQMLADRRETPVSISEVPLCALYETAGLSASTIFEVRARTADGDERTYKWGYRPRVFPWQTEGLQRLNHGIWIAA